MAENSALTSSLILGNDVRDTGKDKSGDGIFIDVGNSGNFLSQNNSEGSKALDCHDGVVPPAVEIQRRLS